MTDETRWTECSNPRERLGAAAWDARAAARWDQPTHGAFGSVEAQKRAHATLRFALHKLNGSPVIFRSVLEIGCGYGASFPVVLRHLREFTSSPLEMDYLGTDPCRAYVDQARRLHPGVPFECLDAREVPEQNPRVDLVVGCAVLSSIESVLMEIVQRARRLWLRPSGILLIAEEDGFHVWRAE